MIWYLLGIMIGIVISAVIAAIVKACIMIAKSYTLSRIPVETATVRIIRRRTTRVHVVQPNGREVPDEFRTACFMHFEDTDGTVTELEVPQEFYSEFREGTCGELVHQGQTFLRFTPQLLPAEQQEEPEAPAEIPAADDFDPALFERRYPEQGGQEQTPMC